MKTLILLLTFILLMGCTNSNPSSLPPHDAYSPSIPLQEVSGTYTAPSEQEKLRHAETLKAYSLGRRIDSNDSSIIHEGGIVYRIENDSAWNLQPNYLEKIPFAGESTMNAKDNEAVLRAEIEVKANEQRALYKYLKEASEEANKQLSAIEDSAELSRKLFQQNLSLKERLKNRTAENEAMNQELLKLKEQMKALLKFYQDQQINKAKSKYRREK